MENYEVISRIDKKDGGNDKIELIAINYIEPTMVKVDANEDIKKGGILQVNGNEVYYSGKLIGQVKLAKSGKDIKVSTDYDIKYTGGYSLDGKTVYLDEHFPPVLNVAGKQIDARKTIGLHHELPEKWMADEDYEYPYAHEVATGIEKKYVESLGVTWQDYCREVDKNLRQVYRRTLEKSPPSLDLAPYLYCRDREALGEIRKSEDL
ncbi:MAG: hypothetical protein M1306_05605 [Candidatus Thermoplasmatota archaeon]|jgi:hypothetical protein|nr:hypothetical protein [Candidatus Thermoplasmatota archaeon]